ncbi:MAG: HAMP domain-containing histidine kinase [Lachnospiraceae bacterium]|nr:HAMP domain-containing histidine kinase [Lachnospiraceae bacterium]
MEEKKTGKFGRALGWLLSICLMAALAGGFVASYPRMTKEARLVYEADFEWQMTYHQLWNCIQAMEVDYAIFVLAALVIVLLLGMLLPAIRPLGLREGWKAHIPLELVVIAAVHVAYLLVEGMPEFIVKCQMELDYPGAVFYWLGIMEDIVADGRVVYVLQGANIALWSGLFLVSYLGVINVRQIFSKGIVRCFKENTLTGRVLCLVCGWIKKIVQFCGEIDFSKKGTRNFVLAVVLNYIAVALLCCTWGFGIFLAVPYSAVLLWLLQSKWKNIRTNYEVLLSTTEEMAEGVTDVEYIGNAGVFHELQTALQGVQAGFHTAVQEEVKSQKMKTELITNVSHDLKTPLTAIITYVDLLKNEELPAEERQKYVAVLEQKAARLKTLIEDLFEISKATSGNIQLDKVELDLVQLIQEVQLELEEEIMQSGITFKVNLPEEKVLVKLDAQKTCRIFENLTLNILKHGLAGSRAYISMEQTEKEVCTVYKNISDAEITYNAEEIVERFTRGDTSRNSEGSGLGLAIVKSFAEAQGGSAKVELDGDLFKVTVVFPKVRSVQTGTKERQKAVEQETIQ